MNSVLRLGVRAGVALLALAATGVFGSAVAGAAPHGHGQGLTCSGGTWESPTPIASGSYDNITVKGICQTAPGAEITVAHDIKVDHGAVLDAQSFTATITVGHDITAERGSLLGLGCQPSGAIGRFAGVPCNDNPDGQTVITVSGDIRAHDADAVFIRKVTVGGSISLHGGGDPEIPWSIKGNTVGRDIKISHIATEWLGVQFNNVAHDVHLTDITALDAEDPTPSVAVVENVVQHDLVCNGLKPAVSPGFIPGETNHVGHKAKGQCEAISIPL